MKPLSAMPAAGVRNVLFDLDDTVTSDGKLTAHAYAALERLKEAGRRLVCVTGRPAGWCDHMARMWPLDAVVGENGAFYFYFADGKLHKRFSDNAEVRKQKRQRLQAVAERVLREVPGTALAADQPYRETDLAIDFREDVAPLPLAAAERIARLMREAGLTARISSIHVNGWFGDYDKLSATKLLFLERFGGAVEAAQAQTVYVGDSPNDAPMFRYFDLSVGVANVREYERLLAEPPKFVTQAARGAGFAELAAHLLRTA